jgi:drug/metabolite transporter (DMT)-like permease
LSVPAATERSAPLFSANAAEPTSLRHDAPLRGIGLVLLAAVFFSSSDVVSKYLAASLPALQITWIRYATFAGLMLAIVAHSGGTAQLRTKRPVLQLLRGCGLVCSSIIFVMSLRYLPLADATATGFVTPLFVTALSIPLLGEQVGWRRWTATLVGLAGVLIVVRPGGQGFQLASLLPMVSALSWAFGLIFTRMMSRTENPISTMTYSALVGLAISSLILPFYWQTPTLPELALCILVGLVSTTGHWFMILAFRHADASVLAPFTYSQLFWASLFGFFLFAALPDIWTIVGSVIIACSGLYTAHRERIRAREAMFSRPGAHSAP